MRVAYFTNRGKVRSNNEDSLLVDGDIFSEENFRGCHYRDIGGDSFILAVADGMGGHAKGEVASRFVLETLKELAPLRDESEVIDTLQRARDILEEYAKANPEAVGLGCAVAGIAVNGNVGVAFNVGDCRVYRFVNGKLIKLTRDHSVVEDLVLDGVITPEEARTHPERNILTSAVIGDGYATDMSVFTTRVDISTGGRFLICSDGLWDELEEKELEICMSAEKPCEKILSMLETKPLKDNVSFIVLL